MGNEDARALAAQLRQKAKRHRREAEDLARLAARVEDALSDTTETEDTEHEYRHEEEVRRPAHAA